MGKPAADDEGMGPLERGRRRYQEKDYARALSAFTEAVNMSSGHLLLTALDHRAAAHEKLQQLQPALLDAKRMIDLKPELSKGYLRCGKILQLKGKPELAFKIYERGLSKVKIGEDKERMLLQSMFNKAKRALDPQKVLDPLVFLPLELAEMVCQHLAMRDRVICLAVSKPWKRLLESSPKLWSTLDTTSAKKAMSHKSLKAHLKRSKYTLDHAIITLRAALDVQKMSYITTNCKNLRRLEIHGSGVIGDSLVKSLPFARNLDTIFVSSNCQMTWSAYEEALKACSKTISSATFLHVKGPGAFLNQEIPQLDSLKSLHVKTRVEYSNPPFHIVSPIRRIYSNSIEPAGFTLQTQEANGLERDILFAFRSTLQEDSEIGICDIKQLALDRFWGTTLKHLIVNNNRHLKMGNMDDKKFTVLPLLETFSCSGTALDGSFIKNLTGESVKRGNLKRLLIGDRFVETMGPVRDEYPVSDTVEELSLASLQLPEQRILQVVNLYPNVRKVDLSGNKVTGVAVKDFVQRGVKYLKLNECSEVSTDAVEWARGRGVEVEFNFPSRSGNTRAYRDTAFAGAF
ncbi:F-box/TPR repeat protein pof3 [Lachnellula suecica]|uniref:F-box/TPR repeat protein pof3 n=1 Tax=Lachnellula suecica TaxID=602035 RepID=A0A8T9C114_9HELO|nr:F-box/TPR repeat protein pof3 [Lachnellula suecica]